MKTSIDDDDDDDDDDDESGNTKQTCDKDWTQLDQGPVLWCFGFTILGILLTFRALVVGQHFGYAALVLLLIGLYGLHVGGW